MSEQTELQVTDETKMDSVESFKFELKPIRGYPELQWRGKIPFTATNFYPAQLKENHGAEINGWMNRVYWGDNLQVMSHLLKAFRGKIKSIYIDPPFDSKVEYKKTISIRGESASSDSSAFEEKQYSDMWHDDAYLQLMFERMVLCRELLSDDGAIYLHCDPRRSHHLRCVLDQVFGPGNFRNEIVWDYSFRLMDLDNFFNRKHDCILFYAKSAATKISMPKVPWTKEELIASRKQEVIVDDEGKEWIWMPGQKGKSKSRKVLVEDILTRGKAISDVWALSPISSSSKERTGYPTQKPLTVTDRIIEASSDPGDLVADFFMGSGTLLESALRGGRRFIGADMNLGAIQSTVKRLLGVGEELAMSGETRSGISVFNVNHYDVFRNPIEARELLVEALEIQPLPNNSLYDGEKDGRMVKIMPVNRIATKADLNPLITGFDYKVFQKRQESSPNKPVESLLLVCMGHEPDLAAHLKRECHGFDLDVEVVDILRDKAHLEFKRESEAEIVTKGGKLRIEAFYPMNLLQKLSIQKERIEEWRELVESVMIDWNYDGGVFEPNLLDVPDKTEFVSGNYDVPEDAGTIRVKITDLLSESLEMEVHHA